MKIELILLGIIGAVFAIDFILKGIKKPTSDKIAIIVDETTKDSIQKHNKNIFYYILKRKKNITLLAISIPTLKTTIHYLFYPETKRSITGSLLSNRRGRGGNTYGDPYRESIGEHINVLFDKELFLFIPAIIIIILIAWFFNDKIKAR